MFCVDFTQTLQFFTQHLRYGPQIPRKSFNPLNYSSALDLRECNVSMTRSKYLIDNVYYLTAEAIIKKIAIILFGLQIYRIHRLNYTSVL